MPHSSYSITVSGIVASSIVVTTSTNGTSATTAAKRSGRMLTTAPISNPPALPPLMARRSGAVYPAATRCSATAMKSVKVFRFRSSFPSSYQGRPSSSPPRTCAMATTKPRSSRLTAAEEKAGS